MVHDFLHDMDLKVKKNMCITALTNNKVTKQPNRTCLLHEIKANNADINYNVHVKVKFPLLNLSVGAGIDLRFPSHTVTYRWHTPLT